MTYNTLSDDGNSSVSHDTNDEIVTIGTYQSIIEADLVRSELESRGISAYVAGAAIAQTFISMPETGITVQVASSDAAVAKQIADELASAAPVGGDDIDGDDEADDYSGDDTESDTDPAIPSEAAYDYEYDVDEDSEDAPQPRAPRESLTTPDLTALSSSSGSAVQESEVDFQRKPGMTPSQPMYDDAEAGG